MAESKESSDEKAKRERLKKRVLVDYQRNGKKPTELSEKYNIPVNTIRSWIQRDKKNPDKPKEKKKRGGQKGNSCAVGAGAPKGSTNALKHGVFTKTLLKNLSEEEKDLLDFMDDDVESMLIAEIKILTLQEHRLLMQLNNFMDPETKVVIESIQRSERKREFRSEEEKEKYDEIIAAKVEKGEQLPGRPYELVTRTEPTFRAMEVTLNALARIQGQKRLNLQALKDLQIARGETGKPSIVEEWITAVMEADADAATDADTKD